jgi:apolipoprotein D and lipocalin family protein
MSLPIPTSVASSSSSAAAAANNDTRSRDNLTIKPLAHEAWRVARHRQMRIVWALVVMGGILLLLLLTFYLFWSYRSALASAIDLKGLRPVAIDVELYSGVWFEQLRIPSVYERGLKRVTATYSVVTRGAQAGFLQVSNTGADARSGKLSTIRGLARGTAGQPGTLRVSFFPFVESPYVVLYVDAAYQMAVVGVPSRDALWLLTRESTVTVAQMQQFHSVALCNGYQQRQLDALLLGQTGMPASPVSDSTRPHRPETCEQQPDLLPSQSTTTTTTSKYTAPSPFTRSAWTQSRG